MLLESRASLKFLILFTTKEFLASHVVLLTGLASARQIGRLFDTFSLSGVRFHCIL